MPPKKRPASFDASRLKVLAAGDEAPFLAHVSDLIASGNRLGREAALDALLERGLCPRDLLRSLYLSVNDDPEKLDPGAHLRNRIAQLLLAGEDARDVDIALRAVDTYEKSMGLDSTANLRALGLRIISSADPALFPYIAAEHVNDSSDFTPEPANTALQLLAATGHEVSVYQWIIGGVEDAALIEAAIDLLHDAPPAVMSRCLTQLSRGAIEKKDEPLLTKIAEAIVERELLDAYPALSSIMQADISKELYGYLALVLARANRPQLLAILEDQAQHDIRRRPLILEALRVRTTPEQAAILKRWEDDR